MKTNAENTNAARRGRTVSRLRCVQRIYRVDGATYADSELASTLRMDVDQVRARMRMLLRRRQPLTLDDVRAVVLPAPREATP